jgi:UDP-N-acetylmuramoylalanine--D-glutamate ligase
MQANTQNIQKALEDKLVKARKENLQRMADIEHRLEFVGEVNGAHCINDAKSTDINSTWYSMDCLEAPIIWIASSSQYEDDYELFDEIDARKLKAMIIMGGAKDELEARFQGKVELIGKVNTLNEAVSHAMLIANEGDSVLFSPACSDYDSFKHYKEAGQQFRKAVREEQL